MHKNTFICVHLYLVYDAGKHKFDSLEGSEFFNTPDPHPLSIPPNP
jgi:hypothetical protein